MLLVEFYKGAPDLVRFQESWSQEHTYLDKLKVKPAPSPVNPSYRKPPKNISTGSLRNTDFLTCSVQKYFSWK